MVRPSLKVSTQSIIEAYRWQRGLGHKIVELPCARIVTDNRHPDVWDANHADTVTAQEPDEIQAVLQAMDEHLGHTPWRVVHTDPFTPDAFVARLAMDGFEEQPPIIQMQLDGNVRAPGSALLRPVEQEADWTVIAGLVKTDHEEGLRTGGVLSPEITAGILESYRAKGERYRFHLAWLNGQPVAYGAMAAAPSGAGMIEDLFTLRAQRRQGVASGMIATFAKQLRSEGCTCIFLGATAGETARLLYARLGFRPLMLTRCWIRRAT